MPIEDLGFCHTCDAEILKILSRRVAGSDLFFLFVCFLNSVTVAVWGKIGEKEKQRDPLEVHCSISSKN